MDEGTPTAQEIVDDLIDEVEEEAAVEAVVAEAMAAAEAIEEAEADEAADADTDEDTDEDAENDEDDLFDDENEGTFGFKCSCPVTSWIQKHPAQVAIAAFGFACLLGGAGLLLYLRQGKE